MKKTDTLSHEFVEFIPEKLENGVLYISLPYATAVHKCCCGCGHEVVTPFSPTDWKLIFDGVSVTLTPSIGNWSFPCRSHYLITNSKINWAGGWSEEMVQRGRAADQRAKATFYAKGRGSEVSVTQGAQSNWKKLKSWLANMFNKKKG